MNPSTGNYTVGKGRILFAQKTGTSTYDDYRPLGNATEFTATVETETLEHYSSMAGLKSLDKKMVLSVTPSFSFSLDEVSWENMELWGLGDSAETTQAAAEDQTASLTVIPGRVYDLGKRKVSGVAITGKTEGTDFVVYTDAGYIYFPETGACTGATTVTFDCAAVDYRTVRVWKNTEIEGKLKFIGDNPAGADPFILDFPKVSLAPEGDMAFIGEDWMAMTFAGSILKDDSNTTSPYGTVILPA